MKRSYGRDPGRMARPSDNKMPAPLRNGARTCVARRGLSVSFRCFSCTRPRWPSRSRGGRISRASARRRYDPMAKRQYVRLRRCCGGGRRNGGMPRRRVALSDSSRTLLCLPEFHMFFLAWRAPWLARMVSWLNTCGVCRFPSRTPNMYVVVNLVF